VFLPRSRFDAVMYMDAARRAIASGLSGVLGKLSPLFNSIPFVFMGVYVFFPEASCVTNTKYGTAVTSLNPARVISDRSGAVLALIA